MMKKAFARFLALALCLVLLAVSALAEPRYPDRTGSVTDVAAVLSAQTAADLQAFDKKLGSATGFALSVVTVDFLDGSTLADYAAELRTKWGLGKNDLLLLLAAGEDAFGLFGGENVLAKLPQTTQDKLLSTSFQERFLRQDYDGAVEALMPVLARELGKVCGKTIDVTGLFGQTAAATAAPTVSTQEWLTRYESHSETTAQPSVKDRFTEEDEVSGMSFGKVVLIVFLLLVFFGGSSSRRGRNGCMGCGCAPFSSILAGLGLVNLFSGDPRPHGMHGPGPRPPHGGMRGPGPRRW